MTTPTIPRILLLGVIIATVGFDLVRAAWDQRALQHEIRDLERGLVAARTEHSAAHTRFQRLVLTACEPALARPSQRLEEHGYAEHPTP